MKTYGHHMGMIQVRNVPDDLHRALKARAAMEGRPLSALVLDELRRLAESPPLDEILAKIAELPPVEIPGGAATLLDEERNNR